MDITLTALIGLPLTGGLLAWAAARWRVRMAYAFSLAATAGQFLLTLFFWFSLSPSGTTPWLAEVQLPWIPRLGISFHLGLDGLSLIMTAMTGAIGVLAVLASRTSIRTQTGFYLFCLLGSLAAINGIFLALDLFLFYIFWELMLIPLFLLIRIWGHEQRNTASLKFFLFTQAGGLLLLLGIIGLCLAYSRETGHVSFELADLQTAALAPRTGRWLMLAFFAAFAVKLPSFPVHAWLADAHTQAPIAGSLVLAGLVLKAGGYGLIRFLLPIFPAEAAAFAPVAMALGVTGILYGALMAFGQNDLKRLIAYTSISHMGYVLLGVFALNELALQGAVMMMVAHAASAAALFLLAQMIDSRMGTRDLRELGGLLASAPRMGGVMMFFAMASLGLPGLAGFVAEFLVLLGVFKVNVLFAALGACGLIVSAVYSLRMIQMVLHGSQNKKRESAPPDLSLLERGICAALILVTLWIGLCPQPFLNTSRDVILRIVSQQSASQISRAEPHGHPLGSDAPAAVSTVGTVLP